MAHDERNKQQIQHLNAGRDGAQYGRDTIRTTNVNVSLWFSILFITIVALGSYVVFGMDRPVDLLDLKQNIDLPTNN